MSAKLKRKKIFRQSSVCLLMGIVLNASAQSAPPAGEAGIPASQSKNNSAPALPPNGGEREISAWKFQHLSPDDTWTRHFRLGMLVGFNIKASFTTSGKFTTSAAYSDGYVLSDARGAGADDIIGTRNFGFDSTSQIVNNQLYLKSVTDFSMVNGNFSSGDSPFVGLDLAYGDSYWIWQHAKVGWEFGFGFLPVHVAGTASVNADQITSIFNSVGGIPLNLLPSGYQGSPTGVGGAAVSLSHSDTSSPIAGTTRESFDVMLYTFRLGPTLYWDLTRRIGLYAGGGPAVGIASGDVKGSGIVNLSDGTTAQYNAPDNSGASLVYGGYVNATLVYHAVPGGDFYVGAQFMPMSGVNFNGSGGSGHLDLGGQIYITAGINWPF